MQPQIRWASDSSAGDDPSVAESTQELTKFSCTSGVKLVGSLPPHQAFLDSYCAAPKAA